MCFRAATSKSHSNVPRSRPLISQVSTSPFAGREERSRIHWFSASTNAVDECRSNVATVWSV